MHWQRTADLVFNLLMLGYLAWLSGLTVTRWIRRGRIESYSEADLLPARLRRSRLLGRTAPADGTATSASLGAGLIAWILLASIVVWIVVQVFQTT